MGLQVRLRRRAGYVATREQLQEQHGAAALPRCLGWPDLLLLGIGGAVGAGVFVLTGVAAHDLAGYTLPLSKGKLSWRAFTDNPHQC